MSYSGKHFWPSQYENFNLQYHGKKNSNYKMLFVIFGIVYSYPNLVFKTFNIKLWFL